MGIQDRDYYRGNATGPAGARLHLGQMRFWRVASWLIAINVAIFLLDAVLLRYFNIGFVHLTARTAGGWGEEMLALRSVSENTRVPIGVSGNVMGPIERWGYFSQTTAVTGLQVWRWITFQFLHANLGHIIGNMLGLYFFGPIIEDYLGRRRFLAFYLLCGMAGPLIYLIFANADVLTTIPPTPLIGASAGVFGILLAASQVAPRAQVMLLFPPIPMQLRTLALVLLGIAAFTVFTQGRNAGGEAAHLGGAALGYLLIRYPRWLDWAEKIGPKRGGEGSMRYHGWR